MSFILSQILTRKVSTWNERVHTEDDLFWLCEREQVRLLTDETIKAKGEYTVYENVSFILFRPKLKREIKLWVGMHELGHHLLHYPVSHKFSKSIFRRMDREANFFAAIALIPTHIVKSRNIGEIAEDYNYPKDLIKIRKEIYEQYKI